MMFFLAAISYTLKSLPPNTGLREPYYFAVADFGYAGLQVSVFRLVQLSTGAHLRCLSHSHSLALSGAAVDDLLMQHFYPQVEEQWVRETKQVDPSFTPPADLAELKEVQRLKDRLRNAVEKIKTALSSAPSVSQTVEVHAGETDATLQLTRTQFDSLIRPLVETELRRVVAAAVRKAIVSIENREEKKEEKKEEKTEEKKEDKTGDENSKASTQPAAAPLFTQLPLASLQITGGSSRIVLFQTLLQQIFNEGSSLLFFFFFC